MLISDACFWLTFRNEKTKALLNSANSDPLMGKRRPSIPFVSLKDFIFRIKSVGQRTFEVRVLGKELQVTNYFKHLCWVVLLLVHKTFSLM